jgi:hypothetical protein
MKIFTLPDGRIVGPFFSVEQLEDGNYLTNGALMDASDIAGGVISEVPDDYLHPEVQEAVNKKFNEAQAKLRADAYKVETDPLFFQAQRGTIPQQEWLDAIAKIQSRFPYK